MLRKVRIDESGNREVLNELVGAQDMIETLEVPGIHIPSYNIEMARSRGVQHNMLITTWGGIGDQICAEPTIRYALNNFKGCDISLYAPNPELFSHLRFKQVFTEKTDQPKLSEFLVVHTAVPHTEMVCEFMCHMLTNCLDFPSICAFRRQLPIAEREVVLVPKEPDDSIRKLFASTPEKSVVIHAGRHWPSKTFPKDWWDAVLLELIRSGCKPILIGYTNKERGTVDVNPNGCLDLRNRLSLSDSIWWLQNSKVLLTNDSSPLHMAATGAAWIGFIATCKHPDMITHWRQGQWGWRMKNHSLGGYWDLEDYRPGDKDEVSVDQIDEKILRLWLPNPKDLARWAAEKAIQF